MIIITWKKLFLILKQYLNIFLTSKHMMNSCLTIEQLMPWCLDLFNQLKTSKPWYFWLHPLQHLGNLVTFLHISCLLVPILVNVLFLVISLETEVGSSSTISAISFNDLCWARPEIIAFLWSILMCSHFIKTPAFRFISLREQVYFTIFRLIAGFS